MTTTHKEPDIRIGLIGLRQSGKTHFLAMLDKVYWRMDEKTTLEFEDRETAYLFHQNRQTLLQGEFIGPTPGDQSDLYRLTYEKKGWSSFRYVAEILDVDGEIFLSADEKVYSEWLTNCNALMILVDGSVLAREAKRRDKEQSRQLLLFERVLDLIRLHLRPAHKGKHKIHIAVCVSKYDLFESETIFSPDELVRTRLSSIYEDVERMRRNEKEWAVVEWFGFSSIGFVWDRQGLNYADVDGNPVRIGSRVSQSTTVDGKTVIFDPMIIRPEGIETILEFVRKGAAKSGAKLSFLDRTEIIHYRSVPKSIDLRNDPLAHAPQKGRSLGVYFENDVEPESPES